MAVDNWRLWLIPFALWGVTLIWYSGYQSGYQEGHESAWEMAKPEVTLSDVDHSPQALEEIRSANRVDD